MKMVPYQSSSEHAHWVKFSPVQLVTSTQSQKYTGKQYISFRCSLVNVCMIKHHSYNNCDPLPVNIIAVRFYWAKLQGQGLWDTV